MTGSYDRLCFLALVDVFNRVLKLALLQAVVIPRAQVKQQQREAEIK
jgi:hypothetical protein